MNPSVTSSGVGRAVVVLVPAILGCPTSPGSLVIGLVQQYEWQPFSQVAISTALPMSEAELATLYAEAAEEDHELAMQGLSDWQRGLAEEDRAE